MPVATVTPTLPPAPELVLWDGDCGLCGRAVAWVKRHDRAGRFVFTPYQEAPWPPMTAELFAACKRAVHVLRRNGTVLRAGRASLYILHGLGWRWSTRLLVLPPFVWFVELGYRIVADHRPFFSRFLFRGEGGGSA